MNANAANREKDKQKLLPEDRESNTARMILCHVIRIKDKEKNAKDGKRFKTRYSKSRCGTIKKSKSRKKHIFSDYSFSDIDDSISHFSAEDEEEKIYFKKS